MSGGRPKNIKSPEELWGYWEEFKKWISDNPRLHPVNTKQGIVMMPYQRPLTWSRFDTWLMDKGIIQDLETYRTNRDGRYTEFVGVITRVNREMYADKFEGASVGQYNANIIARDLGLVDKKQVTKEKKKLTREEIIKRIEELEG